MAKLKILSPYKMILMILFLVKLLMSVPIRTEAPFKRSVLITVELRKSRRYDECIQRCWSMYTGICIFEEYYGKPLFV